MKRLAVALAVLLAALAIASAALAGATTYAGPKYWYPGQSAGSSFSSGWTYNYFFKPTSGYETTVTFIDNVSYGWHATVRNTATATYTYWFTNQVKKGHCIAHRGYHNGSCVVYDS
jgi:hypothetical protein